MAGRWIAVAAAMLILCAGQAFAALEIEARIGFDGYYKPGRWTPLFVTVENNPADGQDARDVREFSGTLEFSTQNSGGDEFKFLRHISLPPSARKALILYVKLPSVERASALRLVSPAGREEAKLSLVDLGALGPKATPVDPKQRKLIVVLGDPLSANPFALPPPVLQPYREARLAPEALPDRWYGLDGVDILFIESYRDDMFSEDQVAAIEEWVRQGGRLVVLGGTATTSYIGSEIDDLLPVDLFGFEERKIIGQGKGLESIYLSEVKPRRGARVIHRAQTPNKDNPPMAVYRKHGQGEIHFWAFNSQVRGDRLPLFLSLTRQRPNDLIEDYWRYNVREQLDPSIGKILSDQGKPPSVLMILILLGVYCLAVGPINFRILYKRKQLEMAWVTIPAIVLVFSVGMYLIGLSTMGRETFHREYHLLTGELNQPTASQRTYAALFSPTTKELSINSVQDASTMIPDSSLSQWVESTKASIAGILDRGRVGNAMQTMIAGGQTPEGFHLEQDLPVMTARNLLCRQWRWNLMTARGEYAYDNERSGFTGSVTMRLGRLEGEIANNTPHRLTGAFLRIHLPEGGELIPVEYIVGDLEPGESYRLDLRMEPDKARVMRAPGIEVDANDVEGGTGFYRFMRKSTFDLEQTLEFPRGRAFLYGLLERPGYQSLQFAGSGVTATGETFLALHIPLQIQENERVAPGAFTVIPVQAAGLGSGLDSPERNPQGHFDFKLGRVDFSIEAPFDPGYAAATKAALTLESIDNRKTLMSKGTASPLRLIGRYYDFDATRMTEFGVALDAPVIFEGPPLAPAASGVGRIRLEGNPNNPPTRNENKFSRLLVEAEFQPVASP